MNFLPSLWILIYSPLSMSLALDITMINSALHNFIFPTTQLSTYPTSIELIEKRGYKAEIYEVVTEDGYILELHHIGNSSGPPVLFMHGFLGASDQWLLLERSSSLPFGLADAGFDIWLGNFRGSYYSRQHRLLSPKDPKFWEFSFHELGTRDLPAIIDYILDRTSYKQLTYIGISMGTTVFVVMASTRPDYGDKVCSAFLLAPVIYTPRNNNVSPLMRLLEDTDKLVTSKRIISKSLYEFLPRHAFFLNVVYKFCTSPLTQPLCFHIFGEIYGENRENWDKETIGFYLSSSPAGSSLKTFHHLSQVLRTGELRHYDYGRANNLVVYGTRDPPEYNLTKITTKILIYHGLNDKLVSAKTGAKLAARIRNLVKYDTLDEDPRYTHVDFLYGLNTKRLVNDDIISRMMKMTCV